MDRILGAAADGSPGGLTLALFESLRRFPSVQRATLWRADVEGSPWRHVRTLGLPTPAPDEISGPGWCATGYAVLRAAPLGALVIETAPGKGDDEGLMGIECLLTMCASLMPLEPCGYHLALEDVGSALPSPDPAPAQGQPSPEGEGGLDEAVSELGSSPSPSAAASRDLPDSGETAA